MMVVTLKERLRCFQGIPALQGRYASKIVTRDISDNILNCLADMWWFFPHLQQVETIFS